MTRPRLYLPIRAEDVAELEQLALEMNERAADGCMPAHECEQAARIVRRAAALLQDAVGIHRHIAELDRLLEQARDRPCSPGPSSRWAHAMGIGYQADRAALRQALLRMVKHSQNQQDYELAMFLQRTLARIGEDEWID